MKLISEGAEAKVFSSENKISKRRQRKGYRIREIDEKLRAFRTKREAKILEKLKGAGARVPKVILLDEKAATIEMELIPGQKLRDALSESNCQALGMKMGEFIAQMHSLNIIHGDLTTSNMILKDGEVYFIDFGLGFFSDKAEDKAVDLHLLKQALNSSHSRIAENCFEAVVENYSKSYRNSNEILNRLRKVEVRGRHKGKKK